MIVKIEQLGMHFGSLLEVILYRQFWSPSCVCGGRRGGGVVSGSRGTNMSHVTGKINYFKAIIKLCTMLINSKKNDAFVCNIG